MFIERYRDSAAGLEHLENLAEFMDPIMATVATVSADVLGEPSPELRAKLTAGGVRILGPSAL